MKFTLCITQQCNLRCGYCYIEKQGKRMSISVADKIVDFIFSTAQYGDKINIGFFGGEPLLEFELLKQITLMIEAHPDFEPERVELTVVTNGTIFSEEIADFLKVHNIGFCVSYDGLPLAHDIFRKFQNGDNSSSQVEDTISKALATLPSVLVNMVYHPQTVKYLPAAVQHLASLGLRQIYINPDYSASWSAKESALLPDIYAKIADSYIDYYLQDNPHFISLIDGKVTVIMRGGYSADEKCKMGGGEFAFTTEGYIYPCERLIGSGGDGTHCIGHINNGLYIEKRGCVKIPTESITTECGNCGIKDYCMNWCGCSNYFSSKKYDHVSPFLCASERAAIQTAFSVFKTLQEKKGTAFIEHISGMPDLNSMLK